MKVGVLFSGGKDSTYAAWLAKKQGYNVGCLISLDSINEESFMFHTPAIELVEKQAKAMNLPLILQTTQGEKEEELQDLERAIARAVSRYGIKGIVTGAVGSVYQASRIQTICNNLNIECFNPLWQKDQFELLEELVKHKFEIILSGVFAYPFDKKWIGRRIDKSFIEKMRELNLKYRINSCGEGGEYESFVLNCPIFKKPLKIKEINLSGEGNAWRGKFELEK